ncbi:MAG: YciI family protein [Pirellulales bacterium]
MHFLLLVKSPESEVPPPPALVEAMAKHAEEARRAGTLLETGGLAPTRQGARVQMRRGRVEVVDGPFTEAKEVIGSFALLELPTHEAAVEAGRWLMRQFAELMPGWEGEVEVRQIFRNAADLPARG